MFTFFFFSFFLFTFSSSLFRLTGSASRRHHPVMNNRTRTQEPPYRLH
ncbi:hypothetical protein GYH30_027647 [Glycine max]|nr:hypothetical protein GYH30_027647 [Glycine max]